MSEPSRFTVPEAAVEAAAIAQFNNNGPFVWSDMEPEVKAVLLDDMRLALEAAAPHMLSHERQQTADAHRDAMVNAQTVDKLNAAIEAVLAMTCKPNSNAVPHNQPDLVPPWYSDRIRAAITEALSK